MMGLENGFDLTAALKGMERVVVEDGEFQEACSSAFRALNSVARAIEGQEVTHQFFRANGGEVELFHYSGDDINKGSGVNPWIGYGLNGDRIGIVISGNGVEEVNEGNFRACFDGAASSYLSGREAKLDFLKGITQESIGRKLASYQLPS